MESLFGDGQRVVIWMADEGRRHILDEYLWVYQKLAFLPHAVWEPSLGEVDEPVVLLGEPGNPNQASVLVVGDDLPPGDWAATFDEVHDLVPGGAEGIERNAWWEQWQQEHNSE